MQAWNHMLTLVMATLGQRSDQTTPGSSSTHGIAEVAKSTMTGM